MTVNSDPYMTVEQSFYEIFVSSNYKSCLLTIGMNAVAIIMPFPHLFKIFYSHSRDLNGMPCACGCVLTCVVCYFRCMSNTCSEI